MPKVPDNIGVAGAHVPSHLKPLFNGLVDDITSLKAQVDALQTIVNDHITAGTHRVAATADAAAVLPTVTSTQTVEKSDA